MSDFTELGPISFTSRAGPSSASRYIEVWLDGEMLSRHTSEAEAIETVLAHLHALVPGDYQFEFRTPNRVMSVRLLNPAIGGQGTGGTADITPPLAPAGLGIDTVTDTSFRQTWTSNTEPDLAHYNIYRSTQEFSGFSVVGQASPGQVSFTHSPLVAGTTYYVKMTAVDNVGNESEFSATLSQAPIAVFWDTIPNQTHDDTYPNTITGLKAAYLTGSGQVVTVHDRPLTGHDLVSSGVVTYDDTTDTLTVISDPGSKEVFLRASESAGGGTAVVPTWNNEPVA